MMKAVVSYRNGFESQCDISVLRLNNKTPGPVQVNLPLHLLIVHVTCKQSVTKKNLFEKH